MISKVSTNIRLGKEQLQQLKWMALEKGTSLSKLFQKMISDYLTRLKPLSGKDWKKDPFFQIGKGPGRSGRSTISENHDEHLYPSKN